MYRGQRRLHADCPQALDSVFVQKVSSRIAGLQNFTFREGSNKGLVGPSAGTDKNYDTPLFDFPVRALRQTPALRHGVGVASCLRPAAWLSPRVSCSLR